MVSRRRREMASSSAMRIFKSDLLFSRLYKRRLQFGNEFLHERAQGMDSLIGGGQVPIPAHGLENLSLSHHRLGAKVGNSALHGVGGPVKRGRIFAEDSAFDVGEESRACLQEEVHDLGQKIRITVKKRAIE